MKLNIKFIIALLIINYSFLMNNANAQIAINNDGTNPNASAILDIQSTTKGFLVPRMTTAQRTAIGLTPPEGLLVYDTDVQSFMIYDNSVWYNFRNYRSDVDNDIKIQTGNSFDDDKVRFSNQFLIERNGYGDTRLVFNTSKSNIYFGENTTSNIPNNSNENNVIIGFNAGTHSSSILNSIILGYRAGRKPNSSSYDVIAGYEALGSTTSTGGTGRNVVMGKQAGYQMQGGDNVIMGELAGRSLNGTGNVVIGQYAGYNLNGGQYNVAIGYRAGYNLQEDRNVCFGHKSGEDITTGKQNTLLGYQSGLNVTTGSYNLLLGYHAGDQIKEGNYNVLIGRNTGNYYYNRDSSVFIGYYAGNYETEGQRLHISNETTHTPLIYGEFDNALLRINGTLNINGTYSFPTSDGNSGQIMLFDGNGNSYWADDFDNISQTLTKSNHTLSLSSGGTVNLSAFEQSLSFNGNSLAITNGNSIDLSGTHKQTLSVSGSTLTVSSGNSITLPFSINDNLGNHILTANMKTDGHWLSPDGTNKGIYLRDDDERLSIGTDAAEDALLFVSGSKNQNFTSYNNYGRIKSGGCGTSSSNTRSISIWASHAIRADKFFATSDERIKDIHGKSNNEQDLTTLMQIEITDYYYKDTISNGNRIQKKVIAQQIAKVYPQAVTKDNVNFIPNIMKKTTIQDGWINLTNSSQPTNYKFKKGEKVKLIFQDGEEIAEVLAVKNDAIQVKLATQKPKHTIVFVYGTEVNDFHIVDYDALSMLNVSATQALSKRYKNIQKRQTTSKVDLEVLTTQASKIDELERMLLEMKAATEQ